MCKYTGDLIHGSTGYLTTPPSPVIYMPDYCAKPEGLPDGSGTPVHRTGV